MTNAATPENNTSDVRRIELGVDGMSCGACARRVEKELNKIDGVHASVEFSTRLATVDVDRKIEISELRGAVENAGYVAEVRALRPADADVLTLPRQSGPLTSLAAVARIVIRWITFGHLA